MASSTATVHLPVLGVASSRPAPAGLEALVARALAEQAHLTAVERFAQRHEAGQLPDVARYRDLMPAAPPAAGQQYAFEVDLDRCSGCKACVAGCHSLNGLDDGETWRRVGVLHGGTDRSAVQRTVTAACHHCVEPACLVGCPVNAYEKDAATGIVRHLDDQCIGCRYCTLTCPYDVPQYNARLGIVRKCDLCAERLAVGEAPACVQACPTEAITVRVVDVESVVREAESDAFLPGSPPAGLTLPTTTYSSARPLPRDLLPADFFSVRAAEGHTPLAVMLVLTQLSVGALVVGAVQGAVAEQARPVHAAVAVLAGLSALAGSVLHLGRPLLAFRAVIGLRHSWLSREIVAFGAFSGAAFAYAAALWAPFGWSGLANDTVRSSLGLAVVVTGAGAMACSIMVYHATRRALWTASRTAFRFFATATLLGLGSTLLATALTSPEASEVPVGVLAVAVLFTAGAKLSWEACVFAHLRMRRHTELKRTALLLRDELGGQAFWRFWCGGVGGVLLPSVLLLAAGEPSAARLVPFLAAATMALLLAGELLERHLFFRAMASARMPGGLP